MFKCKLNRKRDAKILHNCVLKNLLVLTTSHLDDLKHDFWSATYSTPIWWAQVACAPSFGIIELQSFYWWLIPVLEILSLQFAQSLSLAQPLPSLPWLCSTDFSTNCPVQYCCEVWCHCFCMQGLEPVSWFFPVAQLAHHIRH